MKKDDLTSKYENIIKNRIIEGYYKVGETIPSLRSLAEELECSRSVINVVIAKLATQGYLQIQRRQKTFVNDFLRKGSLNIIPDIFFSNNHYLKQQVSQSMLAARKLIEVESVELASQNYQEKELMTLEGIINSELNLIKEGVINFKTIAENDFNFHYQLIKMSNNYLYVLIMNTIKDLVLAMTEYFYQHEIASFQIYVTCHQEIAFEIKNKDGKAASKILKGILEHGEKLFIKLIQGE
ncbi:MAG: GntR family transcriptional regulator [Bacilli bacterium]|nr:GntR family transcriptional regulator [Bacilli bacterium]